MIRSNKSWPRDIGDMHDMMEYASLERECRFIPKDEPDETTYAYVN